jgi:anti-sigma factor RsiW
MNMKTMKCDEVRLLLVGFGDGALADAQAEAVRAHVAGCAGCREALAQLSADAELLRRDEKPEVPAYLAARITVSIRARFDRDTIRNPKVSVMSLVARVAAVVLVGVGVWAGTVLGQGLTDLQPSLRSRLAQIESEASNRGPASEEAR